MLVSVVVLLCGFSAAFTGTMYVATWAELHRGDTQVAEAADDASVGARDVANNPRLHAVIVRSVREGVPQVVGELVAGAHHGKAPAQETVGGVVPGGAAIEQQITVPQRIVALRKLPVAT